ncbi:M15 family metallopeptidase [Tissierella sp. DSM 105185]|uniref:M15 family metallopeptidase n=1 Tax=Tissierella pigra TaxID=2607614 RepID=A0A6N7XPU1_9FIRM|nr:M15 family metallopeptidase [Tissierella pigra]
MAIAFLLDKIITSNLRKPQHYSEKIFQRSCHICLTSLENSKHTKRRAFDICEDNTDEPYGDLEFFRKCAEIGKEVGLTPGYYFKNYQDMPHYELNRWWLQ